MDVEEVGEDELGVARPDKLEKVEAGGEKEVVAAGLGSGEVEDGSEEVALDEVARPELVVLAEAGS